MKAFVPLFLVAATLLFSGCSTQPSPDCLIQYATGGVNYAAAYTGVTNINGTLDAGNPDCQYFTFPGVNGNGRPTPITGGGTPPTPPGYVNTAPGIAGLPFQVSQIGLDKFYPDGGLPGQFLANFVVGVTPEMFLGSWFTGTTASTAFGAFTNNYPDVNDLCTVPTLSPATFGFDFTSGTPDPAGTPVTFNFSNFQLYVTNVAQGTQANATVQITVGTCTAQFIMTAVAPAANCIIIQGDGSAVQVDSTGAPVLIGGNPIPLVAGVNVAPSQEQSDLCTNFTPITSGSSAQQWTNYNANFDNAGNAVNQFFPLSCDPLTSYCRLDTQTVPFPSVLTTARP
jgi:hypothetical protein